MNGRRGRRPVNGLLLLDKPQGMTANAALQKVKWLYQAAKAGHTGSLDPLATGMLPLCFGEATKFATYLLGADKTYDVEACFGARTDTGDADGVIVERSPVAAVERGVLEQAMAGLTGEILQVPPMYSALKRDGRRLYELARAGQEVPREPRPVRVDEFVRLNDDPGRPRFRVRCSKGTYVRTLVEDVAAAAGTLAHVTALRRTAVSPFKAEQMVSLPALEDASQGGLPALDAFLLPMDEALAGCPAVELGPSESFYVRRGNPVSLGGRRPEAGTVRIYGPGQEFLGVGELTADGMVAPRRLVAQSGGAGRSSATGCP